MMCIHASFTYIWIQAVHIPISLPQYPCSLTPFTVPAPGCPSLPSPHLHIALGVADKVPPVSRHVHHPHTLYRTDQLLVASYPSIHQSTDLPAALLDLRVCRMGFRV